MGCLHYLVTKAVQCHIHFVPCTYIHMFLVLLHGDFLATTSPTTCALDFRRNLHIFSMAYVGISLVSDLLLSLSNFTNPFYSTFFIHSHQHLNPQTPLNEKHQFLPILILLLALKPHQDNSLQRDLSPADRVIWYFTESFQQLIKKRFRNWIMYTAKKNLLNCLQLTCRKSQDSYVVTPTILQNLDGSLAGAWCMSTAGSCASFVCSDNCSYTGLLLMYLHDRKENNLECKRVYYTYKKFEIIPFFLLLPEFPFLSLGLFLGRNIVVKFHSYSQPLAFLILYSWFLFIILLFISQLHLEPLALSLIFCLQVLVSTPTGSIEQIFKIFFFMIAIQLLLLIAYPRKYFLIFLLFIINFTSDKASCFLTSHVFQRLALFLSHSLNCVLLWCYYVLLKILSHWCIPDSIPLLTVVQFSHAQAPLKLAQQRLINAWMASSMILSPSSSQVKGGYYPCTATRFLVRMRGGCDGEFCLSGVMVLEVSLSVLCYSATLRRQYICVCCIDQCNSLGRPGKMINEQRWITLRGWTGRKDDIIKQDLRGMKALHTSQRREGIQWELEYLQGREKDRNDLHLI
ncbi:hypothetical protein VP01_580g1 [Puccinia sorghi]|uniref:Uncharacterized protein n=1 Tax=Puccinia sorghi TaxID=27349 RepID=A0A0L6UI91_9BASI|nr:hypothetical protein VP01_580g1 [Puccinia sorghi]